MEGFVGEGEDFKMDPLGGVMWSLEQVWVRRRAAESWMYWISFEEFGWCTVKDTGAVIL